MANRGEMLWQGTQAFRRRPLPDGLGSGKPTRTANPLLKCRRSPSERLRHFPPSWSREWRNGAQWNRQATLEHTASCTTPGPCAGGCLSLSTSSLRLPGSVRPYILRKGPEQMRGWTVPAIMVAAMSLPEGPAVAHPGGLNAQGCHNNRSTGEYHCHRGAGGGSPAPFSPPRQQRQSFASPFASIGGAFRNCAEARGAGAAPVYAGQPGYGPHLDRDGDGVGCEPYRGR